jgi:hypothetical protein
MNRMNMQSSALKPDFARKGLAEGYVQKVYWLGDCIVGIADVACCNRNASPRWLAVAIGLQDTERGRHTLHRQFST